MPNPEDLERLEEIEGIYLDEASEEFRWLCSELNQAWKELDQAKELIGELEGALRSCLRHINRGFDIEQETMEKWKQALNRAKEGGL